MFTHNDKLIYKRISSPTLGLWKYITRNTPVPATSGAADLRQAEVITQTWLASGLSLIYQTIRIPLWLIFSRSLPKISGTKAQLWSEMEWYRQNSAEKIKERPASSPMKNAWAAPSLAPPRESKRRKGPVALNLQENRGKGTVFKEQTGANLGRHCIPLCPLQNQIPTHASDSKELINNSSADFGELRFHQYPAWSVRNIMLEINK